MQLQKNLDQFEKAGISVFAISYDKESAQKRFADEFGITFPLLADPDHKAIEATGILNTLVRPEEEAIYGVPFPGSYMIGADGKVEEKIFFQHYRVRPSAATVLRGGFGLDFEVRDNPRAEASAEGVHIAATLGGESMVFSESSNLYVDIALADGLHLYGNPVPEGYHATEVTVTGPDKLKVGEVQYPETAPFTVSGVDGEFQVFEDAVRIAVPIESYMAEGDSFEVEVTVNWQACTDAVCYMPQTTQLQLEVPISPLNRPKSRS